MAEEGKSKIDFSGPLKYGKKLTRKSRKLLNKNIKWAKKQNRRNWKANKPIIANMTELMNDQMANAAETHERYEDIFVPYQDKFMNEDIPGLQGKVDEFSSEVAKLKADAEEYGSEANKEFKAGQAQASVGQAFEASRENAMGVLESRGINPAATRYAAMDYGIRTAEAAAKAAAGTKANLDVDETSRAMFNEALTREAQARGLDLGVLGLKKSMIDVGEALPGREIGQQVAALGSGGAAIEGQLGTSELALKHKLSNTDFMRSMNESIATWSDTLSKQYSAEATQEELDLKAQELEAASSSGIGGIIGSVLPMIQGFMAEGGPVTPDMSPSGGAIPDDVNVMVDSGEFVFPEAAVRFYGTDKLSKMIGKASGSGNTPGASATDEEPAIPDSAMSFQAMQPTTMAAPPPRLI